MKQCLFICHMIRDNGKSVVCEGNPYIFCLASVDPASESPASVFISTVIDRASLAEKIILRRRSLHLRIHGHQALPSLQHFPSRPPFLQTHGPGSFPELLLGTAPCLIWISLEQIVVNVTSKMTSRSSRITGLGRSSIPIFPFP